MSYREGISTHIYYWHGTPTCISTQWQAMMLESAWSKLVEGYGGAVSTSTRSCLLSSLMMQAFDFWGNAEESALLSWYHQKASSHRLLYICTSLMMTQVLTKWVVLLCSSLHMHKRSWCREDGYVWVRREHKVYTQSYHCWNNWWMQKRVVFSLHFTYRIVGIRFSCACFSFHNVSAEVRKQLNYAKHSEYGTDCFKVVNNLFMISCSYCFLWDVRNEHFYGIFMHQVSWVCTSPTGWCSRWQHNRFLVWRPCHKDYPYFVK